MNKTGGYSVRAFLGEGPWRWQVFDHGLDEGVSFHQELEDAEASLAELKGAPDE